MGWEGVIEETEVGNKLKELQIKWKRRKGDMSLLVDGRTERVNETDRDTIVNFFFHQIGENLQLLSIMIFYTLFPQIPSLINCK